MRSQQTNTQKSYRFDPVAKETNVRCELNAESDIQKYFKFFHRLDLSIYQSLYLHICTYKYTYICIIYIYIHI